MGTFSDTFLRKSAACLTFCMACKIASQTNPCFAPYKFQIARNPTSLQGEAYRDASCAWPVADLALKQRLGLV